MQLPIVLESLAVGLIKIIMGGTNSMDACHCYCFPGDGCPPHHSIGTARHIGVPIPQAQSSVMVEAVRNLRPDVLVVDQVCSAADVAAVRTIGRQGVLVVGAACSSGLQVLLEDEQLAGLAGLAGGLQGNRYGGGGAGGGAGSAPQRSGLPAFSSLLEVLAQGRWVASASCIGSAAACSDLRPLLCGVRLDSLTPPLMRVIWHTCMLGPAEKPAIV